MADLPQFTYHPDPVATGMIVPSEATCPCCDQARGYAYAANPYCVDEVEGLCPWCIADGSAAEKFDAAFCDFYPLSRAGVPAEVIEVVTKRTPGYISWQQEEWLSCCGDACEFHGDISREELLALPAEVIDRLKADSNLTDEDVAMIMEHYQPKGSPAVYEFVCRHCKRIVLGWDCD